MATYESNSCHIAIDYPLTWDSTAPYNPRPLGLVTESQLQLESELTSTSTSALSSTSTSTPAPAPTSTPTPTSYTNAYESSLIHGNRVFYDELHEETIVLRGSPPNRVEMSDRLTGIWRKWNIDLDIIVLIIGVLSIYNASISPNYQFLILHTSDKDVYIIDLLLGKPIESRSCRGSTSTMLAIHWMNPFPTNNTELFIDTVATNTMVYPNQAVENAVFNKQVTMSNSLSSSEAQLTLDSYNVDECIDDGKQLEEKEVGKEQSQSQSRPQSSKTPYYSPISSHCKKFRSLPRHITQYLVFVTSSGIELHSLTTVSTSTGTNTNTNTNVNTTSTTSESTTSTSTSAPNSNDQNIQSSTVLERVKTCTYNIIEHWILHSHNTILVLANDNIFQTFKVHGKSLQKLCKFELEYSGKPQHTSVPVLPKHKLLELNSSILENVSKNKDDKLLTSTVTSAVDASVVVSNSNSNANVNSNPNIDTNASSRIVTYGSGISQQQLTYPWSYIILTNEGESTETETEAGAEAGGDVDVNNTTSKSIHQEYRLSLVCLYNQIYCALVDQITSTILLLRLHDDSMEQADVLSLPISGQYTISTVDNLLIATHLPTLQATIFDISAKSDPLSNSLPLGMTTIATKAYFQAFSQLPHGVDGDEDAKSMSRSKSPHNIPSSDSLVNIYEEHYRNVWIFHGKKYLICTNSTGSTGAIYTLQPILQNISRSWSSNYFIRLFDFLLKRSYVDAKVLLLSVLRRIIQVGNRQSITLVSRLFSILARLQSELPQQVITSFMVKQRAFSVELYQEIQTQAHEVYDNIQNQVQKHIQGQILESEIKSSQQSQQQMQTTATTNEVSNNESIARSTQDELVPTEQWIHDTEEEYEKKMKNYTQRNRGSTTGSISASNSSNSSNHPSASNASNVDNSHNNAKNNNVQNPNFGAFGSRSSYSLPFQQNKKSTSTSTSATSTTSATSAASAANTPTVQSKELPLSKVPELVIGTGEKEATTTATTTNTNTNDNENENDNQDDTDNNGNNNDDSFDTSTMTHDYSFSQTITPNSSMPNTPMRSSMSLGFGPGLALDLSTTSSPVLSTPILHSTKHGVENTTGVGIGTMTNNLQSVTEDDDNKIEYSKIDSSTKEGEEQKTNEVNDVENIKNISSTPTSTSTSTSTSQNPTSTPTPTTSNIPKTLTTKDVLNKLHPTFFELWGIPFESPLQCLKTSTQFQVITQNDMFYHVFLPLWSGYWSESNNNNNNDTPGPTTSKASKYTREYIKMTSFDTITSLAEYIRSLYRYQIYVEPCLNHLLFTLLVQSGRYSDLHQYLQYHIISDSIFIAEALLSLSTIYPPLYQTCVDMFYRLHASSRLLQLLLQQGAVTTALKLVSYKSSIFTEPGLSPREFFITALEHRSRNAFFSAWMFFQKRNAYLRSTGTSENVVIDTYDDVLEHSREIFLGFDVSIVLGERTPNQIIY